MIRTSIDIALLILGIIAAPIIFGFMKGARKGIASRRAETTPPPVAKKEHPCELMHQFTPIDAQAITLNGLPHTTVLEYCAGCRTHHSAAYLGNWPIETFLKKESDAAAQIRQLEGMVR